MKTTCDAQPDDRGLLHGYAESRELEEVVDAIYAVNRLCFKAIAERAMFAPPPLLASFRSDHQESFRTLPGPALACASRCPFLLLEAGFGNANVWKRVMTNEVGKVARADRGFFAYSAVALARSTLMLTWHLCSCAQEFAQVLLGVDRTLVPYFAQLRPPDVERLAQQQAHRLCPRWINRADFWALLLRQAIEPSDRLANDIALRAFQLSSGDSAVELPDVDMTVGAPYNRRLSAILDQASTTVAQAQSIDCPTDLAAVIA